MQFRNIRLIDRLLGHIFLLISYPVYWLTSRFLASSPPGPPKTISFLKLHGGGSLLIALPALLGLRKKFPNATFVLIGTPGTERYAELTALFDRYITIESDQPFHLIRSGLKALRACYQHDICIDLEPHSGLAAVFCLLTFARRRLGLVKPAETYRALAYTDALYFNPHAPIHIFYEQLVDMLDAPPASLEECRIAVRAKLKSNPVSLDTCPRPIVYLGAFASGLSSERMMPVEVWIDQLARQTGPAAFTLLLGGSPKDRAKSETMAARITKAMPQIAILNICGTRSLEETACDIAAADAFWGIDSGLLHIARLVGKSCKSYWGPTNPRLLLQKMPELTEEIVYLNFPCSPCVHVALSSPCKGDNQCLKSLLKPPETPAPLRVGFFG